LDSTRYILLYSNIECNEKLNAMGSLQACIPESLMATGPSASSGPLGMGVSLNNKLAIEKVIDGTSYILMSDIECNQKLNAAGLQ
jgi:hypothetical protein